MTDTYLQHHGILGQKWGIRRYQNKDGTLTSAGKKHKNVIKAKRSMDTAKNQKKSAYRAYSKSFNKAYNNWQFGKKATERWEKAHDDLNAYQKQKDSYKQAKNKYKSELKIAKGKEKSDLKQQKLQKLIDKEKAKEQRQKDINKAYTKVTAKTPVSDYFKYNENTRKLAAKYVVDKNMSVDDARAAANAAAKRNTVAVYAASIGLAIGLGFATDVIEVNL